MTFGSFTSVLSLNNIRPRLMNKLRGQTSSKMHCPDQRWHMRPARCLGPEAHVKPPLSPTEHRQSLESSVLRSFHLSIERNQARLTTKKLAESNLNKWFACPKGHMLLTHLTALYLPHQPLSCATSDSQTLSREGFKLPMTRHETKEIAQYLELSEYYSCWKRT